ncbi:hypothetical protein MIMGU_mgv1a009431mg [Erythranthe guttata]|uniref:TF-B3 domain-containing protein n=1 Tax=Erythranthe guttata TaxID=4155 RepID=A0A022QMP3_ERYGU|nr:hypothetical protein MIMGU_mgv1a009431mg [Erythranthe guttata]
MDLSFADESTTSETVSITPAVAASKSPPESLCRVGSGASAITDAENGVEAESRKLPSSRFKGVVPQPNGRWGAQIYEKHQRRFRGRDAVTNFKPLSETQEDGVETAFLNTHSKAEIVDMLRKHTYGDELEQSRRSYNSNGRRTAEDGPFGFSGRGGDRAAKAREQLFEKAVTPSDVGKLNRLVIPKQHAERHFPLQSGSTSKGVLLNFEDAGGKVWRFRYSYWNSSQSYVLTKGWSRFVKEKGLRAGDIVSFQRSTAPDNQLYIDWKSRNINNGSNAAAAVVAVSGRAQPVVMVRLFGVNIFEAAPSDAAIDGYGSCSGKRMREMELLGLDCSKKQRVIGAL